MTLKCGRARMVTSLIRNTPTPSTFSLGDDYTFLHILLQLDYFLNRLKVMCSAVLCSLKIIVIKFLFQS